MSEPEPEKKKLGPKSSMATFKDLVGMDDVVREIRPLMIYLVHPNRRDELGLAIGEPMASVLLQGPTGCGKTTLARAVANEAGVPFYKISASDLLSDGGVPPKQMETLISEASISPPFVVFVDEIASREVEFKVMRRLSGWIANPPQQPSRGPGYVLVFGSTTAVDPTTPRPGPFDDVFTFCVPGEAARAQILSALTRDVALAPDFDPVKLSMSTPRFLWADLAELVRLAGCLCRNRAQGHRGSLLPSQVEDNLSITMADLEAAAKKVRLSSVKYDGFTAVPDVKWEDIVGLDKVKKKLQRYIVRPLKHPVEHQASGLPWTTGFLLFGPPGCGKTLIANALANEAGVHFIHVKCPQLLVGDQSELQQIFTRARAYAPCILFFDEVDAVTPARGKEEEGRGRLGEQLLSQVDAVTPACGKEEEGWGRRGEQLLYQLRMEVDKAYEHPGIHIIGATNRPDLMDTAILRYERFGHHFYVPLPNQHERGLILEALVRKKLYADADEDLTAIAQSEACADFSGGDLSNLVDKAYKMAFDEECCRTEDAGNEEESHPGDMRPPAIKAAHFQEAAREILLQKKEEKKIVDHLGVSERFRKQRCGA